ncbi:uncharacterized protein LOC144024148 [Festucalex cinctus]
MYISERSMECLPQIFSNMDDDFCQSLKELQSLPTPPDSPPTKVAGLSKGEQLSFVSDILLEDCDMQLNWNCAFFHSDDDGGGGGGGGGRPGSPAEDEDGLWRCLGSDKSLEEMLADMDAGIFEGLAGSALDCHNLMESQETGQAASGRSACSSSDSEEEIDVVTVGRRPSRRQHEDDEEDEEEDEERLALQRHLCLDIRLQHNYAAAPPASPPPSNKLSRRRPPSSRQPARTEGEGEEEQERRRTHNVMERQRRDELRNCLARLRDSVPELWRHRRASKALILKKARDCIRRLEAKNRRLRAKRDKLRAGQEELEARLRRLRLPVRF